MLPSPSNQLSLSEILTFGSNSKFAGNRSSSNFFFRVKSTRERKKRSVVTEGYERKFGVGNERIDRLLKEETPAILKALPKLRLVSSKKSSPPSFLLNPYKFTNEFIKKKDDNIFNEGKRPFSEGLKRRRQATSGAERGIGFCKINLQRKFENLV